MEEGQEYLSIKIAGHNMIAAFPNESKTDDNNHPDFKGDGVAVWINKKKPNTSTPSPTTVEEVRL